MFGLCRDAASISKPMVFLGGACNPTTWRRDIVIPALEAENIEYYNPQVDDWSPDLVEVEERAKASASILLFVINQETSGIASMVEAAYLSHARSMVIVIDAYPADRDVDRGRIYLRTALTRSPNVHICETIDQAVQKTISLCKRI